VVYNPPPKAPMGPVVELQGIDNPLLPLERRQKCTNLRAAATPQCNHRVRGVVSDSFAYWGDPLGVDGFRFDRRRPRNAIVPETL